MVTNRVRFLMYGAAAFALLVFAPATAFADGWSGTCLDFTYSNGGDINGRFGTPWTDPGYNSMWFLDVGFQANAYDDQTVVDADTVEWDILCNTGMVLSYVTVTAYGSYAASVPTSYVDAELDVTIKENIGGLDEWTAPLISTPNFPQTVVTDPISGDWSGFAEIDLSGLVPPHEPEEDLHITMNNVLTAFAAATGSAEINQTFQDIQFEFYFIPEPSTLALVGLGALALLRRRRL